MAAAVSIANSLPNECSNQQQQQGIPDDCGCCIMTMHYRLQNPGGYSPGPFFGLFGGGQNMPPSGNPTAITLAHAIYVAKPCEKTVAETDYPRFMYDSTTTVEKRSKFDM